MAVCGGREMVGKIKAMAAKCAYLVVCTSKCLAARMAPMPPWTRLAAENRHSCAANGEELARVVLC